MWSETGIEIHVDRPVAENFQEKCQCNLNEYRALSQKCFSDEILKADLHDTIFSYHHRMRLLSFVLQLR